MNISEELESVLADGVISAITLSALTNYSPPAISLWRAGAKKPSREAEIVLTETIRQLKILRELYAGLPFDWNNTSWLRSQLRVFAKQTRKQQVTRAQVA